MIFIKTGSKRKRHGEKYVSSEDFEAQGDVKKSAFTEYCLNLLNKLIEIHTNLTFFHFMYSTVHIFYIFYGTAPSSVKK